MPSNSLIKDLHELWEELHRAGFDEESLGKALTKTFGSRERGHGIIVSLKNAVRSAKKEAAAERKEMDS